MALSGNLRPGTHPDSEHRGYTVLFTVLYRLSQLTGFRSPLFSFASLCFIFIVGRMENVTQKFQVNPLVVDDGLAPGGDKHGLAECRDMDRQLAAVAATTFDDVPDGLLNEIFQCVYFSDLLGYRR